MNHLSKAKAKELKSLSLKKERDVRKLFLAEGEKCVIDSLEHFVAEHIVCSELWLNGHPEIKRKYEDRILLSDKRGLEIISSLSSLPEVIAVLQKPEEKEGIPCLEKNGFYLLLDDIQDPGNLGTIIRTCDWFGVYDIFASPHTADAFSPKVVQATMGSLSRVRIHYLDLASLIKNNPEIKVIGTLLEGIPLNKFNKSNTGFLLMGNEGRGLSEELKKKIDMPLTIPPFNTESHPDSLNVAVATAIILSHLR